MDRLVYELASVLAFVKEHTPVLASEGMQGIGLERDGALCAGVLFERFNGQTVWMHVAGVGHNWLTRRFMQAASRYPFVQLGVRAVRAAIAASNERSIRLVKHLGFLPEAKLRGAASDGGDVVIFVGRREWCRYV